jgi:transcriptional regulator of acetoin/glycerol metabolism
MKSTKRSITIAVFSDTPGAAISLLHPLRPLGLAEERLTASGEPHLSGRKPVAVYTLSVDTEEPGRSGSQITLAEVERTHIRTVLELFDWKLLSAAKALGINRTTLYRKMKRYGIEKETV